jgi:MoxR-like ATPase
LGQEKVKGVEEFIKFGALGRAIRDGTRRVIVLIDEVDKADIDFPNDLLWVLDKDEFLIPELAGTKLEKLTANQNNKPIVIITSNREKELPGPFLRRCFYHFIKFPNEDALNSILAAHVPDLEKTLRQQVVQRFSLVRDDISAKTLPGKLPSTSELIDWAKALKLYESEKEIMDDLAAMKTDLTRTPFKNVLLKDQEQIEAYQTRK